MDHNPYIAVVGSIIYDFRVTADRLPHPGETVTGYGFGTGTGGKGANQAVAAARLGAVVHLVGRVGEDAYADQVYEQFEKDGLDCEHIVRDPEAPTATCLIHIDRHGENDIIIVPGANGNVSSADVEAAREKIEKSGVLLLQNEVPFAASLRGMQIARKAGRIIIYNPAPAKPLPEEIFPFITYFTPNETEAEFYSGVSIDGDPERARRAAAVLRDKGIPNVIITLGGQGAYCVAKGVDQWYPPFPIEPVDTTAAGDAFNGGLAVMLSEGRPIPQAIRFANAAGAVCSMKAGAQNAIGTRREIEALIGRQEQ